MVMKKFYCDCSPSIGDDVDITEADHNQVPAWGEKVMVYAAGRAFIGTVGRMNSSRPGWFQFTVNLTESL